MKYCIFDDSKQCDDCNECNTCELDPGKICDNCCRCIEGEGEEYRKLNIREWQKTYYNEDEYED